VRADGLPGRGDQVGTAQEKPRRLRSTQRLATGEGHQVKPLADIPGQTFVVLVAKPTNTEQLQVISARLWSSGYLSGEHAGCSFRGGGDPILYINNPPGVTAEVRRNTLDGPRDRKSTRLNSSH